MLQETLRIHPNTGLILERIVPREGAVIDGYELLGGTIVGVNAWVLHQNKSIFGEDVDVFRPDRWLEANEDKSLEMKRHLFSVCDLVVSGAKTSINHLPEKLSLRHTDSMLSCLVRSRSSQLHWEKHRSYADEQACGRILPPIRDPACAPWERVERPRKLGHKANGYGYGHHEAVPNQHLKKIRDITICGNLSRLF